MGEHWVQQHHTRTLTDKKTGRKRDIEVNRGVKKEKPKPTPRRIRRTPTSTVGTDIIREMGGRKGVIELKGRRKKKETVKVPDEVAGWEKLTHMLSWEAPNKMLIIQYDNPRRVMSNDDLPFELILGEGGRAKTLKKGIKTKKEAVDYAVDYMKKHPAKPKKNEIKKEKRKIPRWVILGNDKYDKKLKKKIEKLNDKDYKKFLEYAGMPGVGPIAAYHATKGDEYATKLINQKQKKELEFTKEQEYDWEYEQYIKSNGISKRDIEEAIDERKMNKLEDEIREEEYQTIKNKNKKESPITLTDIKRMDDRNRYDELKRDIKNFALYADDERYKEYIRLHRRFGKGEPVLRTIKSDHIYMQETYDPDEIEEILEEKDPNLDYPETIIPMRKRGRNTKHDKLLQALPPGVRISKNGNIYTETRANRSDITHGKKKGKRI